MSPEQIDGVIFKNSDVFSLGIVFYQLFLDLPDSPFKAHNTVSTMLNICEKKLPSLISQMDKKMTNIDRNIYGQLSKLISQALKKDPQKRIQEVKIIAEKLTQFLQVA